MKDVSAMENEELLNALIGYVVAIGGKVGVSDKIDELRAEVLYRLNRLPTLEANERMAYEHNRQVAKGR